jgi:hypothetical protein
VARTGRPPTPTERKRALGNPGKRALPDRTVGNLAAVAAVDAEPFDLDPVAVLESVIFAGRVWLAATDSVALSMLRESIEERQSLRSVVISTQSETARKALRDLDKQIIGQLSLLGFDPAARSRLGLAEVKAASTLEKLRQSRG